MGAHFRDTDLMRISASWAVVQAYYVMYYGTQASEIARGHRRSESHPSTQRQFVSFWVDRSDPRVPWSLGADKGGFKNLPANRRVAPIQSWTACTHENCWDLASQALRTTRERSIAKALDKERQERKRKRLDKTVKEAVSARVSTHGLIHYLWRLRVTANYSGSEVFIYGPDDDDAAEAVIRDLRYLSSAFLLMVERDLGRYLPAHDVTSWMIDWTRQNIPRGKEMGVALRLPMAEPSVDSVKVG